MADELISQFNRNYNQPIETFRQVADITERDGINSLRRWEGMLVYVISEGATYELRGATDNTAWSLFTGIAEAPSDGSLYGRKDGAWQLVPEITAGATAKLVGEVPTEVVKNGVFSLSSVVTGAIQGNQMAQDGDVFRIKFHYSLDPGPGTTSIYVRIGSTDYLVGIQASTGLKENQISFELIRRTSSTYFWSYLHASSPTLLTQNSGSGTQDFTSSFPISVRITSTDAGNLYTNQYIYFQQLNAL